MIRMHPQVERTEPFSWAGGVWRSRPGQGDIAVVLAGIDPRFILDEARWTSLAKVVVSHWPEQIAPGDLVKPELWAQAREAHAALEAVIG